MVGEQDPQVYIEELKDTFDIGDEQAKALYEAHDAFLDEMNRLPAQAGVILGTTSTIAYAASHGMDPYTYMTIVKDVLMALSQNPDSSETISEA